MGRGDRFRHLPAAKGGQGKEHLMVVIGELQSGPVGICLSADAAKSADRYEVTTKSSDPTCIKTTKFYHSRVVLVSGVRLPNGASSRKRGSERD